MNEVRIGVVGVGAMGADHIRTLTTSVPAARVTQVFDTVRTGVGIPPADSAEALIEDPEVDAVVIASPDFTHADLAVACVKAGKPVLCEKPLAVTAEDARRVVDAEVAAGRRFVQIGFMRRYDPGFVALRAAIADGELGEVRLVHAVHRNASSTTSTDDVSLVTGSMVHELDTVPWLLGDELTAIRVESPVTQGFRDPQLATLWTRRGVMASVEVFVNAGYGYDVRCEVVGTRGSGSLEPASTLSTRVAGLHGRRVRDDFVAHFADAYRIELGSWVQSVGQGTPGGPSAWDGYAATVAARAGVASLASGRTESVDPGPRPELYR
ncbi:Gfo/Idh/MocA family oxidoreductase [Kineosporia succinea]|uniref:Myo-inositol 2-dehydrogenase/D-chiro-inositol 1-dehydrogenase n=1 Tax=Kineosporia succinea TaxID=84632 RepID=A0ABT9PEM3_9ACTN|nr:Gfo/Idh/MocA family oxidoreductase [Kineosporia succinea]MDP9831159.1 myo-inositol 2-dehydrogenase/D-chiro-inositol 1-dehydrogenase [Kineosporia succinea]